MKASTSLSVKEKPTKDLIQQQDKTIGIIDKSRIEIKSEIHGLRDDLKSHFDDRLSKIEFDMDEIKAKVDALYHSSSSSQTNITQAE